MKDCLFCKIIKGDIPCYKVYEDDKVIAFLDINPHGVGHTLVIPKEHCLNTIDASDEIILSCFNVIKKIYPAIDKAFDPMGIRIVQNNKVYQDIKHLHFHIVPGYKKEMDYSLEEALKLIKDNI